MIRQSGGGKQEGCLRIVCRMFGHRFRHNGACACGALLPHLGETRIRHVLSCFCAGHTYARLSTRDGHNEYACADCGHPLLIAKDIDLSPSGPFLKRVNYRCGWFGHDVHRVRSTADGYEYACACGHSFVTRLPGESRIEHPWRCFLRGHRIEHLNERYGYTEYICLDCGHPFLYPAVKTPSPGGC
jgi:DNA-directed RNA polymerase subunit RPC12/RpoP